MKLKLLFSLFVVLVTFNVLPSLSQSSNQSDITRNITELIQARGYPFEQHHAVTPDGYILSIQRIPAGQYQSNPNPFGSNGKPVVILQHGVEDIGCSWVIQENVYQSLGYILADAGFDVWINNVRGTYLSNTSINLDPSQTPYWQFSFDQMAQYDLPTVLDYVLGISKVDKVGYVGHSQGTTMGFIAFENTTIASKINLFVALAPVVRVYNCKSLLLDALADLDVVDIFELIGDKSFLMGTPTVDRILPVVCRLDPSLCQNSLALIMGWDTTNINNTRLPVYMSHEPGGTSVMNVAHWAQAVKSPDGLYAYDYGSSSLNTQHYGQPTPPKYNPSSITVPIIAFYGGQDYLADPTDVEWLLPQLQNLVYKKYLPTYSHLDFVWGETTYIDVYDDVVTYLKQYSNQMFN